MGGEKGKGKECGPRQRRGIAFWLQFGRDSVYSTKASKPWFVDSSRKKDALTIIRIMISRKIDRLLFDILSQNVTSCKKTLIDKNSLERLMLCYQQY